MKITTRCARISTLLSILSSLTISAPVRAGAAAAIPVVVPIEASINLNGNSALAPFDSALPERFQQVYSSSAFNIVEGAGGGIIDAISFRVDASLGHPFIATIPNLQLNLSTTTRAPDELSSLFDENVGLNDTVVINPGEIRISSNGGGGFTSFDLYFTLNTPFRYNPADGNLLMDFRIYQGIKSSGTWSANPVAVLDGFNVIGDSVSTVYGYGSTMPSSGQVGSFGLATLFSVEPVPEPSTVALLVLSLGAVVLGRLKKGKG